MKMFLLVWPHCSELLVIYMCFAFCVDDFESALWKKKFGQNIWQNISNTNVVRTECFIQITITRGKYGTDYLFWAFIHMQLCCLTDETRKPLYTLLNITDQRCTFCEKPWAVIKWPVIRSIRWVFLINGPWVCWDFLTKCSWCSCLYYSALASIIS